MPLMSENRIVEAAACIDYLSHPLSVEQFILCHQQINKQIPSAPEDPYEAAMRGLLDAPYKCQLQRMQNVLWRRSSQQSIAKHVSLVQPEKLNWQKENDVTWLYGPLYHYFEDYQNNLPRLPKVDSGVKLNELKSALKKKSQTDVIEELKSFATVLNQRREGKNSHLSSHHQSTRPSSRRSRRGRGNERRRYTTFNDDSRRRIRFSTDVHEIEFVSAFPPRYLIRTKEAEASMISARASTNNCKSHTSISPIPSPHLDNEQLDPCDVKESISPESLVAVVSTMAIGDIKTDKMGGMVQKFCNVISNVHDIVVWCGALFMYSSAMQ